MRRRQSDGAGSPAESGHRVGTALRTLRDTLDADCTVLARRSGESYVVLASSDPEGSARPAPVAWERSLLHLHTDAGGPALTLDAAADPVYGPLVRGRSLPVRSLATVAVPGTDGVTSAWLSVHDSRPGRAVLVDRLTEVRALAGLLGVLLEQQEALAAAARERQGADDVDVLTRTRDLTAWTRLLEGEQPRLDAAGATAALAVVRRADRGDARPVDTWLVETAALLRRRLRGGDVLARTGAVELSVMVPGSRSASPPALCDRLSDLGDDTVVATALATPSLRLAPAWERLAGSLPRAVGQPGLVPRQTGPRPAPVGPALSDLLRRPAPAGTAPGARLQLLLEAFARHLDMTMAYVSELDEERMVLRHTWAARGTASGLRPGLESARRETYCAAVLEGRLPQVVPDTSAFAFLGALPATDALPIGSYLGAPVILSDGRVHGSICAFRETPHPDLGAGHVGLVDAVASAVAGLLEEELVDAERRSALRALVDDTVAAGGPPMHFQPVVSLAGGAVIGYEALARFRTLDQAALFRAAAEVDPGDRLERAAVAAATAALPSRDGFLAVNLSARALLDPTTLRMLAGLDLGRLVVEVSEHEAVEDYAALGSALAPLRADGLRLAVDDAGAGFASLRHVLRLAPDLVKLDIAMVRGVSAGSRQAALLGALASFATDSGIVLVAEGVETPTELAALIEVGVHAGQGFLLGRPAPLVAA